jgi:hypothetical protein
VGDQKICVTTGKIKVDVAEIYTEENEQEIGEGGFGTKEDEYFNY